MSREITRKQLKHDEFVEAAFDLERWFEANWRKVAIWFGGAVLVVVVALLGKWWHGRRMDAARELLARGLEAYRTSAPAAAGSPAADLDEAVSLFEQAAARGGRATVGHVAAYYRAAALLRAGRAEEAIPELEQVVTHPEPTLAAAARSLLAGAYAENGRTEDAIELLRQVSEQDEPYASAALLKLGFLLRDAGRSDEAHETLSELTRRFPQSSAARQAGRVLQSLDS